MPENSEDAVPGAAGAVLGLITISDEDADDTHTVEVDNDHFQVIDHAGAKWLTLKSGVSLDFEEMESVTVTVTVTDSGDPAESASAEVTITVTDVNEAPSAPVVVDADDLSVDENDAGASVSSVDAATDPEGDTDITYHVDDDRFEISSGRVLKLKDGVSLDHEAISYVMLKITARDSDGNESEATTVTVHVNDVNEGPNVTGKVAAVTANAGADIKADPIDLAALFSDPDNGDSVVRYEASGLPSWLTFSVEFGKDDDGNDTVHGILNGTAPAGDDTVSKVTLTASDGDGAEGSTSFYVISDDGNDDITDVDLIDSAGNVAVEADADENDASGVVLGEIRVQDQDHDMHPNGMHLIQVLKGSARDPSPTATVDSRFEVKYDDAGIPWLVLSEGQSLDYEAPDGPGSTRGSLDVTIRAVDMNGAVHAAGPRKGEFMGSVEYQTVTIVIGNQNDAPKANTIGNWWVTVEDGMQADEISKGEWLEFSLDTDAPGAAFTDPDGDKLTYTLSGPSILEIDEDSGEIVNTEGGRPVRGVHRLTVTATDPDGESATAHFYLSIGFSDPEDNFEEDNSEPEIRVTSEVDYVENSGEQRVATFTVTDDDNDLGHHPFALDTVIITAVVNPDSSGDTNNDGSYTAPATQATDIDGYGGAFRLSEPTKSGDTWTYHVYVRDTNLSPLMDSTSVLNPDPATGDGVDEIEITITASDGVADPVTETIDIKIEDGNDRPTAPRVPPVASGEYGVNQSERLKEILYIKLEEVWTDIEDDADDFDDFGASTSGSWIKILHGPAEWGDIEEGRDGDEGTDDDVGWNVTDPDGDGTAEQTAVVIGADSDEPDTGEYVVIIEIDRTGKNNGQGDRGSFTLTARDDDGGTGSRTYTVTPNDQNLPPSGAVTLSGSPREDATLRANFNENKDPDLAGSASAALVLYQWFRVDSDGTESSDPVQVGTSNSYRLSQLDVGNSIRVKVKYYEVGDTDFVGTNVRQLVGLNLTVDQDTDTAGVQTGADAITTRAVTNTPDKGRGSVTVLADTNQLTVADPRNVSVTDGDYVSDTNRFGVVADGDLSYSWEVSDNGRGGWTTVQGATTSTLALDGDPDTVGNDGDGKSKHYRAVVTYNANNDDDGDADTTEEMESIYSDPVQVSNIRDATAAAPTISGNAFPGGTLSVNAPNTSVQWQSSRGAGDWTDIPGATGSLTLTQAHAGLNIRALVSTNSTVPNSPGVTSIVAVNANGGSPIQGGTSGAATPVAVDDADLETTVQGTGHHPLLGVPGAAALVNNNAGHNLSLTETVNLRSLFQDPDSARLTFTVAGAADSNLGTLAQTGTTYVWDGAAGGVLVFEASTGKLTFNSDVYRAHDGAGIDPTSTVFAPVNDGTGNVITLNITARDEGGRLSSSNTDTDAQTAAVNLRINVAPSDIRFQDPLTDSTTNDASADATNPPGSHAIVSEHTVGANAQAGKDGQLIATLNVLDENDGIGPDAHKFGTHEVEVSGDDRFMIVYNGYSPDTPGNKDSDTDGSTWEVRLKPGAKLDYETQVDMKPPIPGVTTGMPGKQIVLIVTATDGGGLSTPTGAANEIELVITIDDLTRAEGDPNHSAQPNLTDVPGLEDDEANDTDEREDDETADDDVDGGAQPPPPGTSLGGIIEDFVDNMDTFEQDLLEDFMLVIDDGIDIA